MPVASGTRLGPYEILGPLGAGGMGEVYRARDSRLGREVAVKVLPAERLSDPARRARFEREARAVAALNHPNIVTLHGIESADGADVIVMELVAGQTLQTLISRHAMAVPDALRIAIPLADALATAHAAGIVHRDVKPANVMVTPSGVVKVLDFGLAKLRQPDEASVGEATTQSRTGAVMGTAGYMSPEQAAGEPADARSDVFSFGVVLYEMVTGQRAFAGHSTAEVQAAVLRDEPKAPSEIAPGLPKELERIIQRCLRKDPERRFQSMRDVTMELQELAGDPALRSASGRAASRGRQRWLLVVVAIVAIAATTATVLAPRLRPRREGPPPRLVTLAALRQGSSATFSPDGTQIAFGSPGDRGDNWDIWLKIVGESESRRLTSDPAADGSPAWSPDGKRIAFVRFAPGASAGTIYLVSPLGGMERRVAEFPVPGRPLSWSPDSRWLLAPLVRAGGEAGPETGGIHLVSVAGGEPRPLTFPKAPTFDQDPALSPDGRTLAYFSCEPLGLPACDVHTLELDADLRPHGSPRRLTQQRTWGNGLAWTRDGRSIVYGVFGGALWRLRADGSAPPERVELAGRGADLPFTVTSSDRLGFRRDIAERDVHRFQLGSATAAPLIASTGGDTQPQYSPDGKRIAFESDRDGDATAIWLADADGSHQERFTHGPGRSQAAPRWSPDGRTLVFEAQGAGNGWDTWTIETDGSGLRQVTRGAAGKGPSSWSRDGRWIYVSSARTGRCEIWRVGAAGVSEEQLTRGGGWMPFESPDGTTLYYKRAQGEGPLLARPVAGGPERTVIDCVPYWGWVPDPQGVFHLDCGGPANAQQRSLRHWEAKTGRDRVLTTVDSGPAWPLGLSVSPNGRSVLFVRTVRSDDLMMIENFR